MLTLSSSCRLTDSRSWGVTASHNCTTHVCSRRRSCCSCLTRECSTMNTIPRRHATPRHAPRGSLDVDMSTNNFFRGACLQTLRAVACMTHHVLSYVPAAPRERTLACALGLPRRSMFDDPSSTSISGTSWSGQSNAQFVILSRQGMQQNENARKSQTLTLRNKGGYFSTIITNNNNYYYFNNY
jgi:hypothetical protein